MPLKKNFLLMFLTLLGVEHLSIASENKDWDQVVIKRGSTKSGRWIRIPLEENLHNFRQFLMAKKESLIEEEDHFEKEGFIIFKEDEANFFVKNIIEDKVITVKPTEKFLRSDEKSVPQINIPQISDSQSLKRQGILKEAKFQSDKSIGSTSKLDSYDNLDAIHQEEFIKSKRLNRSLKGNLEFCQEDSIKWRKLPNASEPKHTLQTQIYYTYNDNSYEIKKFVSGHAGLSMGIFGFGFKNEYTCKDEQINFSKETEVHITALHYVPKIEIFISIDDIQPSQKFTNTVRLLNIQEYSENEYLKLIKILDQYGYYLPTSFILGGAMYSSTKESVTTHQEASKVSRKFGSAFEAKLKLLDISIGNSASLQRATEQTKSRDSLTEKNNISLSLIGGDPATLNHPTKWIESLGPSKNWSILEYGDVIPIINILDKPLQSFCKSLILEHCHYTNKKLSSAAPSTNMKAYGALFAEDFLTKEWYEEVKKGNNVNAQKNLGTLYYKGLSIRRNLPRAIELFKKAAYNLEGGSTEAQIILGTLYYEGRDVLPNPDEAIRLFEKAAEQGSIEAQIKLGTLYYEKEDFKNAIRLFDKAADQGSVEAQRRLGTIYYKGYNDFKPNPKEAAYYFQNAVNEGNVEAQRNLAILYYRGAGVEKNLTRAEELLKQAAEKGNAKAQYNLGDFYKNTEGFINLDEAKRWFKEAADQGNEDALRAFNELDSSQKANK